MERLLDTMDANGDRRIDFSEFHFFMKRLILGLCIVKPSVLAEQELADRLARETGKRPPPKDKDRQTIDREEVRVLQSYLQSQAFINTCATSFSQYDINSSGSLDS